MSISVLIAGTGKMGRNIGAFLLGEGYKVCWFSRSNERIESIRLYGQKQYNRLSRSTDASIYEPEFATNGNIKELRHFDLCIESIEESLDAKIELLESLHTQFSFNYLFSNSSSVLPSRLHPRCIGLHFFYPLQLHPCAELITHSNINGEALMDFFANTHLTLFHEIERNAFAINRLLLPIQVETICMLQGGFSAPEVDSCTCSSLLAMGQIRIMQSIGAEILTRSIENYQQITTEFEKKHLDILIKGIKNLPGAVLEISEPVHKELKLRFLYLFINTCLYFIEHDFFTEKQIDSALELVFGAEESIRSVIEKEGRQNIRDHLSKWYDDCGRVYFKPGKLLD